MFALFYFQIVIKFYSFPKILNSFEISSVIMCFTVLGCEREYLNSRDLITQRRNVFVYIGYLIVFGVKIRQRTAFQNHDCLFVAKNLKITSKNCCHFLFAIHALLLVNLSIKMENIPSTWSNPYSYIHVNGNF